MTRSDSTDNGWNYETVDAPLLWGSAFYFIWIFILYRSIHLYLYKKLNPFDVGYCFLLFCVCLFFPLKKGNSRKISVLSLSFKNKWLWFTCTSTLDNSLLGSCSISLGIEYISRVRKSRINILFLFYVYKSKVPNLTLKN